MAVKRPRNGALFRRADKHRRPPPRGARAAREAPGAGQPSAASSSPACRPPSAAGPRRKRRGAQRGKGRSDVSSRGGCRRLAEAPGVSSHGPGAARVRRFVALRVSASLRGVGRVRMFSWSRRRVGTCGRDGGSGPAGQGRQDRAKRVGPGGRPEGCGGPWHGFLERRGRVAWDRWGRDPAEAVTRSSIEKF